MKYLLDTDHLSILQRQSGQEFAAIMSHLSQVSTADITLAVISFHEQIMGCHTYLNRARTTSDLVRGYYMLQELLRRYASSQVLPFDSGAEKEYDQLLAQHLRIGTMDLRIAAVALSRQLVVVTRNQKDFGQVPGLQLEDWTR